METNSLILHDYAKMQEIKDDEETDPVATQLSLSIEQLRFSSSEQQEVQRIREEVQRIREELFDSSLYSGVGFTHDFHRLCGRVELTLKALNFKCIHCDSYEVSQCNLKTILATIAQSKAYPKTPEAAGSQPFVIALFLSGVTVPDRSPSSFHTPRGSLDIVDDIIKPFLPKSAPHLVHIPKLFFISNSLVYRKDLDNQPPSFPDDDDANYCIAYHLSVAPFDEQRWLKTITDALLSGETVQDVIENSRSSIDKNFERLYTFCCLKDKLVLRQ